MNNSPELMAAQGRHQWALQCKGDPIQTWSVLHEEIPKTKFWGEISLKPEIIILIIMEVISFWRRWCQSFYYCSVVTIIFFVSVQNLFTIMKKKLLLKNNFHSIIASFQTLSLRHKTFHKLKGIMQSVNTCSPCAIFSGCKVFIATGI